MIIVHPLPEKLLQTPLYQLPFVSSQINSSIHKTQHDITKYLEENIIVCLENQNQKQLLSSKIKQANDQYKQLELIGKQLQFVISTISDEQLIQKTEEINYREKIFNAIRNQNYDEIIKLFNICQDSVLLTECAKIAANSLATPTKNIKQKLKLLLQIISKNSLIQDKDEIIEICTKVLLQKCFKMYFQQNIWNTNKNQATYYSDIIQLYQKCFNCAFRILQSFDLPNYYQGHLANIIFDKFNQNVLEHLITPLQRDKSIHVILNFKNIEQCNLFHLLTNIYCQNILNQQLKYQLQQKTNMIILRQILIKGDQQISNILQSKEQLNEYFKQNKQILFNQKLYQNLFNNQLEVNFEQF